MSFYVIEQGRRVATPIEALFPRRGVQAVARASAVEPIDEMHSEAGSQGQWPVQRPVREAALEAYRESAEPEQLARRRVITAADIMTRSLRCLAPEAPLLEAWTLMQHYGFHHVIVTNARDELVGIVSDRDVWRALSVQPMGVHPAVSPQESMSIQEVMTKQVVCADATTSIRRVAEVMLLHGIDALPVTTPEQTLQGLVTRTDLLRALVLDAPLELWI